MKKKSTQQETEMRKGNQICAEDRRFVLSAFVHRYTCQHKPDWAKKPAGNGKFYAPQYATDAEWLENTLFQCKNGRVDQSARFCQATNASFPKGQWLEEEFQK